MRDIRNKFAHHPTIVTFDDDAVANQYKAEVFLFRERAEKPRLHFLSAVFGVLAQIHGATLTTQAPSEKPDDTPAETRKAEHREKVKRMARTKKDDG